MSSSQFSLTLYNFSHAIRKSPNTIGQLYKNERSHSPDRPPAHRGRGHLCFVRPTTDHGPPCVLAVAISYVFTSRDPLFINQYTNIQLYNRYGARIASIACPLFRHGLNVNVWTTTRCTEGRWSPTGNDAATEQGWAGPTGGSVWSLLLLAWCWSAAGRELARALACLGALASGGRTQLHRAHFRRPQAAVLRKGAAQLVD